ncbi:MAG TPA: hypothetical protein VKW76_00780 [Candidatus Binatia bacterium]|nr:hypothetical protein [Candidatus Binatia bacterium]
MDDRVVAELEVAVAETGTLLVRLEKYRAGTTVGARALRGRALALGDRARRAHHAGVLDAAAAGALLVEARTLAGELGAALAAVETSADHRTAAAAYAAGDLAALAAVLPNLFVGVEVVAHPPDLYHPAPWLRRGRPRPPAEVAAAVAELARAGIAAEADDVAPAVDAALPAVVLAPGPPAEAVALRFAAAALPAPLCRIGGSGEFLLHAPRLHAPFIVVVRSVLDDDDAEAIPVDWLPYRRALLAALAAHGLPSADG